MTSSSAATSRPIDVLVADSNRMQSQLLISALRRRREFNVAACQMEAVSIVRAVAQKVPAILLLSDSRPQSLGDGHDAAPFSSLSSPDPKSASGRILRP
jgi:hypothetical protein